MPTYHIWTIGCQMNRAESERIAARFEELGYTPANHISEADIIVLNSCVVRGSAEDRVINKLHDVKHLKKEKPQTLLALTGFGAVKARFTGVPILRGAFQTVLIGGLAAAASLL